MRAASNFGNCNVQISNCIFPCLREINGGKIDHCVITSNSTFGSGNYRALYNVNSATITNNIFFAPGDAVHNGNGCYVSHNCIGTKNWGDDPIVLPDGKKFDDVFVANKGITISSNYSLKTDWGKNAALDGTDLGIYGGTGFSDEAVAPIPRIVSKKVAERTDGSGKLQIEVTVKAQ